MQHHMSCCSWLCCSSYMNKEFERFVYHQHLTAHHDSILSQMLMCYFASQTLLLCWEASIILRLKKPCFLISVFNGLLHHTALRLTKSWGSLQPQAAPRQSSFVRPLTRHHPPDPERQRFYFSSLASSPLDANQVCDSQSSQDISNVLICVCRHASLAIHLFCCRQ